MKGNEAGRAAELRFRFRNQYGLITRRELRLLGVTAAEERRRRAAGEWEVAGPGVLRLGGLPPDPGARAVGGVPGVRPHRRRLAPVRGVDVGLAGPVPRAARGDGGSNGAEPGAARRGASTGRLPGARGHRPSHPVHQSAAYLVDLAAVSRSDALDAAVDRALAQRLLTVWRHRCRAASSGPPGPHRTSPSCATA